jgi:parallel beta-helix repeat protein
LKKEFKAIIIIVIIITSFLALYQFINPDDFSSNLNFQKSKEVTIYVDNNGKGNFKKIQNAIDNASNHDSIFIYDGIYKETLNINKSLKILGENKKNVIIDGNYDNIIVDVRSDYVNISNITIKNSNGFRNNAAIKVRSQYVNIIECEIYRNRNGVYFQNSNNNIIKNCLFHTNGIGLLLENSSDIIISNSEFCHNGLGINLKNTDKINIFNSYAHENGIGLFIKNSSNINIDHSSFSDNNDNQCGSSIYNSLNIKLNNSILNHNGVGLEIYNTTLVNIKNCNLNYNTHFTIYLRHKSKNIIIDKCIITENLRYGIHATESKCKIINSHIFGNKIDGVHIKDSYCDASNNWWGTQDGPLRTSIRLIDFFDWGFGKLIYKPWYESPIKNIGTDWYVEDFFVKTRIFGYGDDLIKFEGMDKDRDGLPDWWEKKWNYRADKWNDHLKLDPDGDGLNNFEECYMDDYNSNPYRKDLYLEFDWMVSENSMVSNKPPQSQINIMKNRFAEHDINLHVDVGNLGGGEEIPYAGKKFLDDKLLDLYWDYFIHNNLNNPRKNIFHYALICDYGPGPGFAFIGWGHLNSFCISGQQLKDGNPAYKKGRLIVTGAMHETGHTLGLFADDHEGNDNRATIKPKYREFWIFKNYKSCMNYRYTWDILDYSDGSHGFNDFDDWGNLDFSFFKNTHYTWKP